MTGQLFVVPAALPHDPYERLVLALDDGRELRFRDIRKFGRLGLYGADDDPFDARRAGAAGPGVHPARVPEAHPWPPRAGSSRSCSTRRSSPGSATSTPTRRLWRPSPPAAHGPVAAPGRRAPAVRRSGEILAEAVERRGSSIDDYTAPDGDGEMQEHLEVYQRTGEPCLRCGRPIRRIVVGDPRRRTSAPGASGCRRPTAGREGDPADADAAERPAAIGPCGRRWVDLEGEASPVGRRTRRPGPARADGEAAAAAATRRAAARGAQHVVTVVCPGSVIEITLP